VRAFRLFTSLVALTCIASCATSRYVVPAPNPDGLPPAALNLRFILRQGCLPLVRGQKTETEAMRGVGLILRDGAFSFPGPNAPPSWVGNYLGINYVDAGRSQCAIVLTDVNLADVRRVVDVVVGATPEQTHVSDKYKPTIPEIYEGCVHNVAYSYNVDPPSPLSPRQFEVHLHRASCP